MEIKLCNYEAIDYLLDSGVCLRYYKSFKARGEVENKWLLLSSENEIGESENIINETLVNILLMIAKDAKERSGTCEIKIENLKDKDKDKDRTMEKRELKKEDGVKQHKEVLVIDDSVTIRAYHEALLKTFSFDVESAENGMEGLEKSIKKSYDLILCDINMPIMDGFEFVKKFRKSDKKTPVVFITTLDSKVDRKKGLLAGANLYIVKPINLDILKEILDSISK